ncbi:hypothetical protein GCM10028808_37000 [Spirosoma migulaei]
MKNLMVVAAAYLFSSASFAQDKPKKEVKMEMKEMKHDAKVAKKEAKMEGDHMKADAAKDLKHDAKMMKKDAKKLPNR